MRRATLAVLLTFLVPVLLFGQHHGSEGGSSSGSSGSSSSSGGYSGGHSGSSDTYHSSSSSSSTSSSSSSSSSSSGSSGNSHSSSSGSSSSGSSSGGSSRSGGGEPSYSRGGGHSGTGSQPGASGSVGTHTTKDNNPSRSNLRTGDSDSSGRSGKSWSESSSNLRGAGSESGSGSQLFPGNSRYTDTPVQFHLQNALPRADLDKARQEGKLDADFLKMGLEPNKQAYQQKMAHLQAAEKLSSEKPQGRLSKFLFGDREKNRPAQPEAQASLRRCVLKECGPVPPPCTGKNCRPGPPCLGANCAPPPPPQNTCAYLPTGYPQPSGYCQPLGYIDHCDGTGQCYAHLGRVNGYYCDTILQHLKQEQEQAAKLLHDQGAACSSNPQNEQCVSATNDYQTSLNLIRQLATQYQMCRAAAGLGPANINLGPAVVTSPPSLP